MLVRLKQGLSPVMYRGEVREAGVPFEADVVLPHFIWEAAGSAPAPNAEPSGSEDPREALKARIRAAGGTMPRGRASLATLEAAAVKAEVRDPLSDYPPVEDDQDAQ